MQLRPSTATHAGARTLLRPQEAAGEATGTAGAAGLPPVHRPAVPLASRPDSWKAAEAWLEMPCAHGIGQDLGLAAQTSGASMGLAGDWAGHRGAAGQDGRPGPRWHGRLQREQHPKPFCELRMGQPSTAAYRARKWGRGRWASDALLRTAWELPCSAMHDHAQLLQRQLKGWPNRWSPDLCRCLLLLLLHAVSSYTVASTWHARLGSAARASLPGHGQRRSRRRVSSSRRRRGCRRGLCGVKRTPPHTVHGAAHQLVTQLQAACPARPRAACQTGREGTGCSWAAWPVLQSTASSGRTRCHSWSSCSACCLNRMACCRRVPHAIHCLPRLAGYASMQTPFHEAAR